MGMKETNPKDAVGVRKAPMSTVPAGVLMELGVAMLEGARKYGRHNYRVAGIRASVYYDGTMRHMMDWWEGADLDPDSGISHITKAIAGLVVLRDAMLNEMWTDDRPPRMAEDWLAGLNRRAGEVIDRHPDAVHPYTEAEVTRAASRDAMPSIASIFGDLSNCARCGQFVCAEDCKASREPTVRIQGSDVPVEIVGKPKGWNAAYGEGAGYEDAPAPSDVVELTDDERGSLNLSVFMGEDRFEQADPAAVARRDKRYAWKPEPTILRGSAPDEGAEGEDEFDQQFDAKLATSVRRSM